MRSTDIAIESNPLKGILICFFAYFFVSLIGIFEKSISTQVSLPMILFFQNMICLLLVMPKIIKSGVSILKTNSIGMYALRIISGLGCYATLFYSIRFMPISEAFVYQYTASLWIPFIMLFCFNVRMSKNLWFGILIGFVGMIVMLRPSASMFGLISIVGISCGILQAISVIAIRRLSIVEPTLRILFYYFLVGSLGSSFLLINNWRPITLIDFIWLVCVGVSTYLAQKYLTISLKYANATTLAPICYASILFTGLISWVIWDEVPSSVTLFGMLLVIFGCLLSVSMGGKLGLYPNRDRQEA